MSAGINTPSNDARLNTPDFQEEGCGGAPLAGIAEHDVVPASIQAIGLQPEQVERNIDRAGERTVIELVLQAHIHGHGARLQTRSRLLLDLITVPFHPRDISDSLTIDVRDRQSCTCLCNGDFGIGGSRLRTTR